MAITRSKTFVAGEVLTASDLNNIESNIIDNAQSLTSPRTAAFVMNTNELQLDTDNDTAILADTDDRIDLKVQSFDGFRFDGTVVLPVNGIDFKTAATGNPPEIVSQGEANIDLKISADGTGAVQLGSNLDLNGNAITADGTEEVVTFTDVASAVNQVNLSNAASGNDVAISAEGETNVGITIKGKGTGTVKLGDADLIWPDSDGSANQSLTTNGSGTLQFQTQIVTVAQLRNYIAGYVMSPDAGDVFHDINVTAGTCISSDATTIMQRAEITKQIDAGWTAGDDAGGFPTGASLMNDSWYHFFIIEDGSGTVDAGFDDNVSATNLLSDSGYTKYRRVGSVLTDGSSDIIGFKQVGDLFLWDDPPLDINDTTVTSTAELKVLSAPFGTGVQCQIFFNAASSTSGEIYISSGDADDEAPSTTVGPLFTIRGSHVYGNGPTLITNTSGQVRIRAGSSTHTVRLVTLAYRDFLGRWD